MEAPQQQFLYDVFTENWNQPELKTVPRTIHDYKMIARWPGKREETNKMSGGKWVAGKMMEGKHKENTKIAK